MTNEDLIEQIAQTILAAGELREVTSFEEEAEAYAIAILRDVPLVGAAMEMREACRKAMGALGYTMGEHDLACQCEQCAAYLQLGNALSKLPKE